MMRGAYGKSEVWNCRADPRPRRVRPWRRAGPGLATVAKIITGNPDFDVRRQYAVFIGIDRCKEWTPLRGAVAEASGIERTLTDRYVIDRTFELYDDQATAANIRHLFLDTLPSVVGPAGSLFVFYSGHGQTDASGTGFWIAVDGSKD